MKLDNRWVNADGTLNEMPIVIRYRESWKDAAESAKLNVCVQIAWNAASRDDSSAYPSQEEMEQIEAFHHQLQANTEADGSSVVAMVITHDGVNQWVIYTSDLDAFKAALDKISAPPAGYPIEVVADEDPEWATFKKVSEVID